VRFGHDEASTGEFVAAQSTEAEPKKEPGVSHPDESQAFGQTSRTDSIRQLLVVDDDPMVLAATIALLQAKRLQATGMSDGRSALKLLAEQPQRFAGILIDFILPDMSGGELLQRIRELDPNVPVILCSGMDADQVEMPIVGRPHAFLKKPYRLADMERILDQVIGPNLTSDL